MNKQLTLRHYGDVKAKVTHRGRKDQSATLVNGIPQIADVKAWDTAQHKLHYRSNDGSSFI